VTSSSTSHKGFSLLELVVAIAIAAILGSLALPSFISWQRNSQLRGAATNLMADLEAAKIRAVRENSFVAVLFATDRYTIFVDNGDGGGTAGDWIRNGTESLIQQRILAAGLSIPLADLTLINQRVRFNGRGLPLNVVALETIPLQSAVGRRTVSLSRLGSLQIQ
jgi:prepilin-type N-terminal cleavage/methylation domain-containing protein